MATRPPIGLFGRIATGRLVIPGYDKVAVAPACVLLAGVELSRLLAVAGGGVIASISIVVAVCLFLSLALGPSQADWELTGNHRLVPFGPAERRGMSSPHLAFTYTSGSRCATGGMVRATGFPAGF